MHTDVAETIFDIVKVLPETKQHQVLDYVTDLRDNGSSSLKNLLRDIERRGQEVPEEIWDELPSDGSIHHDHYLYGAKKRR